MAPDDLIFGEGDLDLPAPADGIQIPPADPAGADNLNGLSMEEIRETLAKMRNQVEQLSAIVDATVDPAQIPQQTQPEPPAPAAPAAAFPDFPSPEDLPAVSADPQPGPDLAAPAAPAFSDFPEPAPAFEQPAPIDIPGPAVPAFPEPAAAGFPEPAVPTPAPADIPQPAAFPDPAPAVPAPAGFPQPAATGFPEPAIPAPADFPEPAAFPQAPAPAFEQPAPADFPAPTPMTDFPAPTPMTDFPPPTAAAAAAAAAPAFPEPAGFPQPAAPAPAFEQPAPADFPPPTPAADLTPSPYQHQQPAPPAPEMTYPPAPAATDAPLRVQDVLVAIADRIEDGQAQTVGTDTILSHMRSDAQERRVNTRTKKNTRRKGAVPQFLRITTRFLPGRPLVISVFSPKGGVGKSTTAANLAAYIAKAAEQSGEAENCRVLLVDGDVANGNLALRVAKTLQPNMLDMINHVDKLKENRMNLDDWERDIGPWVLAHPRISNLDILAAPDNPEVLSDLVQSDLDTLMRAFAQFYQVIIYDCGTQLTEWTNCAWLNYASQVYLMVEPEIACLASTAENVERARMMNLITPDVCRVVCIRSDMDLGQLKAQDVIGEMFSYVVPTKQFYMPDFHRDAIEAGNAGEFLTLDSPEYAESLTQIVRHSLESYEKDFGTV